MGKLNKLRDMLCEELEEYGEHDSLDMHGLETVDLLAHAIKNIDKIMDAEDDGYSSRGNSYRYESEGSYRGRGRNAKRDSMGRYSTADLRSLMDRTNDERTRADLQRMIDRME